MIPLYDTAAEAKAHAKAIESLVKETQLLPDVVRATYEHELVLLKPDARVKDFLVLFTLRRAREALRSAQH